MFNEQMTLKEFNMTPQTQELIAAIKALPGHQVFKGNGCIVVARTSGNSISQRSVWLGRSSTIANLQQIIAAAHGA